MKESELLKIEAQNDTSDNDQRDIAWLRKIERAERKERFEETLLPRLKALYEVHYCDSGYYEIISLLRGKLRFYPKANSLLIIRDNYWVKKYAINWIKKNLLNTKL